METPAPYSLASDHHYPAHPAMLRALESVNQGFLPSYEGDVHSARAKELLCEKLNAHKVFFCFQRHRSQRPLTEAVPSTRQLSDLLRHRPPVL